MGENKVQEIKSDIDIAKEYKYRSISDIIEEHGISKENIIPYGKYSAKISLDKEFKVESSGKLILVTAINPTPLGEGKTTMTIGIADGINKTTNKKAVLALREPSLGPVFGVKGGATGGGRAQVAPMENINLHFNGDFHAIESANNLLAALIDNHIFQENELGIDPRRILFKRVVDMNDRALRNIVIGLGGKLQGVPREDGFDIAVASEIMAILCLSKNIADLKERIGNILIAYSYNNEPIYVKNLKVQGAIATVLKDAMEPNAVQTLYGSLALVHGGPFANIAHGCNSIRATRLARGLGDFCITEAGFGCDLGAEKFIDIKARLNNLKIAHVVIVATVRALKYNGGVAKENLEKENVQALEKGLPNLIKHIETIRDVFKLPVVVCINSFYTDTDNEIKTIKCACEKEGVSAILCSAYKDGYEGSREIADYLVNNCDTEREADYCYSLSDSITDKIESVAQRVYGAKNVEFDSKALKEIEEIKRLGVEGLPICIAKTQMSLSDNPKLLGRPKDFTFHVKSVYAKLGAGFIVVQAQNILTMPGLPKYPAALAIDIDDNGNISGLF